MKKFLCKIALNIMLKEKDKIGLTNKQKSQVEALLVKVDRIGDDSMFTRKAKWIYFRGANGIKQCKCSNCKTSYGCMDTPYCPNCGRKMCGFKNSSDI
ncbi:MAG: hypothetical protein IJE43_22400 [Alphaproteobacteria bacterium]|nr:hypothetical protein [Alphaproteobacteria bacterium]